MRGALAKYPGGDRAKDPLPSDYQYRRHRGHAISYGAARARNMGTFALAAARSKDPQRWITTSSFAMEP